MPPKAAAPSGRARSSALGSAGRDIARSSAAPDSRPSSTLGHRSSTPAGGRSSTPAGGRISTPAGARRSAKPKGSSSFAGAAAVRDTKALDHKLREALQQIFKVFDADKDGFLSPAEFVGVQRLIAELHPAIDESAAEAAFLAASKGAGRVTEEQFFEVLRPLIDALGLSREALLEGLDRLTSKGTPFGRAASQLANELVRNTSNIADEEELPPPELWRTATGNHTFALPAGVSSGPAAAQLTFKVMQYLGQRTEDHSAIASGVAAMMMPHRGMFKQIFDACGEIAAVHCASSSSTTKVDLFLQKPGADQLFRLRIGKMQIGEFPQKCVGMGDFEPGPCDPSEVPSLLMAEMNRKRQNEEASCPPPAMALSRGTSMMPPDLQDLEAGSKVVLTATPVAQHVFRIRLKLVSARPAAPNYILLVPKIISHSSGHPRYAAHEVKITSGNHSLEKFEFKSFCAVNVPKAALESLVVEHCVTNCRVRVSTLAPGSRLPDEAMPVPELSPAERVVNLADDFARADQMRKLLEARGLGRRKGERDIAFAIRLGKALCEGYRYDAPGTEANMDKLPGLIWELRFGDCSAFNAGFVYGLRAYDVPARVSLGFKYGSAVKSACGSFVATHAQAEFFAEDIGWVPCDATLGVKRLGHEGGSTLSFVEWRPEVSNLEEAAEMSKVLISRQGDLDALRRKFRLLFSKLGGVDGALSVQDLAEGLARSEGLGMDAATLKAGQVMALCDFDKDSMLSVDEFVKGMQAVELGKFKQFGTGKDLASTAQAGAKMFEGGPYTPGNPLDAMSQLHENMLVMQDIDRVMEHVGCSNGKRSAGHDWGSMWPYGVFTCSYDFEERLL